MDGRKTGNEHSYSVIKMFEQSENLKQLTDYVFNNPPMYKIQTTAIGWQVCPVCSGAGIVPQIGFESLAIHKTCDVCTGKKIISLTTGKPPED